MFGFFLLFEFCAGFVSQVVLSLRADGATVPESVSKWADEANWMGGDAVVLSSDTAEVCALNQASTRRLGVMGFGNSDWQPLSSPLLSVRRTLHVVTRSGPRPISRISSFVRRSMTVR